MIDTDKYEGLTEEWEVKYDAQGRYVLINRGLSEVDAQLIADAPLLLEEVKRLREENDTLGEAVKEDNEILKKHIETLAEVKRLRRAWQILRSRTEMSCVCFSEYPDKQDINTHELMDLAMKEAIE
jgi:hypothetical protein